MIAVESEKRIYIPPPGYEPAVSRWVWALEDARRRTKDSLEGLSQESLEEHIDRLDATRNLTLRALRAMPEDDLYRIRTLAEYETTPEWVLHHLMQHEAEHRGQIGDLRLQAGQAHL